MKKKTVALLLALVLVFGVAAGGTLAWLTAQSDTVTNTFTTSDINIELEESANLDLKMIPGWTITKDPEVTVKAGSEACWLFVKVTENTELKDYITYSVQTGEGKWTRGEGTDGIPTNVYYRAVTADATADQTFEILTGNQVAVKDTVTKADMQTAKTNAPTLTFTAYASQLYKNNTERFAPADAWANINPGT